MSTQDEKFIINLFNEIKWKYYNKLNYLKLYLLCYLYVSNFVFLDYEIIQKKHEPQPKVQFSYTPWKTIQQNYSLKSIRLCMSLLIFFLRFCTSLFIYLRNFRIASQQIKDHAFWYWGSIHIDQFSNLTEALC